MIPALIGAAVSLASAAYGASKSASENNKARRALELQKAENKKWYDMKMAQDYTGRSDSQAILNRQRELLNEQYKRARATNSVAGGTEQSLAAQKKAANDAMSDTMTNMAANASAYKDQAEEQYRTTDAQLTQKEIESHQLQAAQVAQAASQGVQAGLNLVGSDMGGSKVSKVNESVSPTQAQQIAANARKGLLQSQTQQQMFKEAEKMNKINVNPFK